MQTIKYRTRIHGEDLPLAQQVLENIPPDTEVEVTVRPLRQGSALPPDLDQVMDMIQKKQSEKYPHIAAPIHQQLRAVAGLSSQRKAQYAKYSDKELLGMARMEKYLEKGEILESLF